ncbi:conjugal transfer protein TraX [Candidatus Bathyarchaeota archaeon]|nr:conjugal transfer protein TraX [Candidatus Bathyarchaeota archaeon]
MEHTVQRGYDLGRESLKWLAIATMTIDHVGVVLYPENIVLRYIGRLSFPLIAYLLMLGLESTRNAKNYLTRLLLFALISQVPFYLARGVLPWEYLNIFFTLSLGVLFIYFFERNNYIFLIPLVASAVLPLDFDGYGIATIGCFYALRKNKRIGIILFILLNLFIFFDLPYQSLALLALPLILLHNDGRFPFNKISVKTDYPPWRKYFFYAYYPLHLLVLYFLKIGFYS